MKGRTNSKLESIKGEKLNINLITNQSDHSDLIGATITVKYADLTITEVWNGSIITIEVPAYVDYTVSVSAIPGYLQPDSYNSTAIPDNSLPLTFTYIVGGLKINILSNLDNDTTISSVKVKVYKKNFTTNITYELLGEIGNEEILSVSYASSVIVKIEFPEVEGYKKPDDVEIEYNGSFAEYTGTYKCELLTVNVTADSGSVSGFEVTISKQETVGVATKYTRLEYIQSSGTQYIDTGFKPNQDTRVVMDADTGSSHTEAFACLFGVGNTASSSVKDKFSLYMYKDINGLHDHYAAQNLNPSTISPLGRHVFDKNKNITYVDGVVVSTFTSSTFQQTYSLPLLAGFNGSNFSNYASLKLYSCQIYDNGTLVRDYIPALRSDGIAGLYDSVNDAFYASNGTSNFAYGTIEPTIIATQTSVTGSYKIPFDTSYTVKANNVSGYTTPSSVTRVASEKSYIVNQQYTVITVRDLSLFDVYGNPINRSTANCYVVREAGQYKFPLVYGNAIKNGQINTAAFTNNGGTYSHDFVDGNSNVIDSPYIENVIFGFSDYQPTIMNEDTSNLVSGVTLEQGDDCHYIRFEVSDIPSGGANIVISFKRFGLYDCPWSWHIWLWSGDLSPVEITNSTGVKYNIMPVNLASKYDSDGVHIKNWFYQWGRKDPMLLPSAWNSTTDHSPGEIYKTSKASNLAEGFSNSDTFYYNSSSPYNWFGTQSYYNLWDAACTGTGNSDNDTVKTVYDPCPVGWKVPNGNVFTGFTKTGGSSFSRNEFNVIGSFSYGWKFKRYSDDTVGVFFPASGSRDNSDGSLINVGSGGDVWISSASTQEHAYLLRFGSGFIYPRYSLYRSFGASVRPVQDDNIQLEVIMISFTIEGASYQAESGMTWFEWVNSSYNTGGFYTDGSNVKVIDTLSVADASYNNVSINNNIIGGYAYVYAR